jgi:hypothetical protein
MRYLKTLVAAGAALVIVSLSAVSARQAAVATPEAGQEKSAAESLVDVVPDQETRRLPVPDEASVTQARDLIRQAYVDEYAQVADNPEPFIRKLLDAAGQTEDPARKYAMLLEAEEAAVTGGDHARAMDLVDLRAADFDVDAISRRLELLEELLNPKSKPKDDVLRAIYTHATETAERSLVDDRLEQGREAAELAKSVGYKLFLSGKAKKDDTLVNDGESKQAEAKRLAKFMQERLAIRDAYQQALQRIKVSPDDSTANGVVGQYLCFVRGNWQDGLPALSSSDLKDLQLIAKEELAINANPEPKRIFDLAGRWWDVAGSESTLGAYRQEIRNHSAKLYKSVEGTLVDPLDRQLAEKRAAELSGPANSAQGDLRRGLATKLLIAIPSKSDRPGKKLVDRLKGYGFEISEVPGDLNQSSIAEAPLVYIQGGSFHDQPGFDLNEVADIKRYVKNGGSLLCAGLAWPWAYKAYGNKPVPSFPLNKVGAELGFEITGDNIGKPVASDSGLFRGLSEEQLKTGGWWPSKLIPKAANSEIVSKDPEGRPIVIAYQLGRGRVMVFGHPGMLDEDDEILRRSIRYLLPKAKPKPQAGFETLPRFPNGRTQSVQVGGPNSDAQNNGELENTRLVGGQGGRGFEDEPPRFSAVAGFVVRCGDIVDAIQVLYRLPDGGLRRAEQHGGNGGREQVFELLPGEQLIGISGQAGARVGSIQFHTNRRVSKRYGLGAAPDNTAFELPLPPNSEFVGFAGKSGSLLDAIGLRCRKK